jgi:hypothetical protein
MKICYIAPVQRKPYNLNYYLFLKKSSIILSVCILNISKALATEQEKDPMAKLDEAGDKILKYTQNIGKWICIMMCVFEILKKVKDGDTNAIWGIIIKYAIAYGSLYAIKWLFDLIASLFA